MLLATVTKPGEGGPLTSAAIRENGQSNMTFSSAETTRLYAGVLLTLIEYVLLGEYDKSL